MKTFLVFPTGLPGAGLLLLRVIVAVALSAGMSACSLSLLNFDVAIVAAALSVGILTRIAATAGAIIAFYLCYLSDAPLRLPLALLGLFSLSLAMLGAGGYSVDAALFGRRIIKLED